MSKNTKEAEVPAIKIPKGGANVVNLPTDSLSVKKGFNPRSDLGDLTDLKRSLKQHGMIAPITVCPTKEGSDSYYVIAGHRRLAAWKELGKANIPAAIRNIEIDSDEAFALAVSENSDDSRTSLAPMDQAAAFRKLLDSNGGNGNEAVVAELCGYSTVHVKRTLKLLDIPAAVRKRVESGDIGKLAAIATLDIPEEVRDRVVEKIGKGTTEADVLRMASEAKREARAKEKESSKGGTASRTKTGKVSKHNVPVGQKAGDKAVQRGAREVRKQMQHIAADALNAREDKDTDAYALKTNQLAALFWAMGSIDEIDTKGSEFKSQLKEIEDRLTTRMAEAEAEAEKKPKSQRLTNKHSKSQRITNKHTKSNRTAKSNG